MKLFKVTGYSSKFELRLEHPIHLDGDYCIGLGGFYSDNFVTNINQDVPNCISVTNEDVTSYHGFDKGFYTFDQIKQHFIEFTNDDTFEMKTILNKIQIKSPIKIFMTAIILDLLGFDESQATLEPNKVYIGTKIPKLRPFDVIEIHCNLVEPSFENHDEHSHLHKESEILYSFFPNVEYGSKISDKPNEIDYLPIKNINKIQTIIISIQDGEGNLLNNENTKTIVYLRLKKV